VGGGKRRLDKEQVGTIKGGGWLQLRVERHGAGDPKRIRKVWAEQVWGEVKTYKETRNP